MRLVYTAGGKKVWFSVFLMQTFVERLKRLKHTLKLLEVKTTKKIYT